MNKFTIFTIIFSISVITVTADLVIRSEQKLEEEEDGSQHDRTEEFQASVITTESSNRPSRSEAKQLMRPKGATYPESSEPIVQNREIQTNAPSSPSITQELIQRAGFKGSLSEKYFTGKVFQLLDITKTPVDAMALYEITEDSVSVVSVTHIVLADEIRALQLYMLLQNKTKPYIDLSLNETNAYGDRSFYVNHAKKPDEAFLVVKIGNKIYAFAYVKTYHAQLKQLLQLLNT